MADFTKLTVNLPDSTVEKIKKMAAARGITVTEALRQVIENQGYLHEEMIQGSKLLIEKPDRQIRELVIR